MPVISEIKTTKKGRYALFCDGEFIFSIDEATLCEYRIKVGTAVDDELLIRLRAASDNRRALDKAMSYLDIREHSSGELREKLLKNFDEDTADYAIAYLERISYVSDSGFAEKYAEELLIRRRKSLCEARARMNAKHLSREDIESALSAYQSTDLENARYLIENKYAGKSPEKTAAALIRSGFASGAVRAALRGYTDD